MTDFYMRKLSRVAVAQICRTIGYNATQNTSLELLQDVLHKFLLEFSRDLHRQVEHYNRTDANLDDTFLTLNSLNVNISEIFDYIGNVEPIPFAFDVPPFPIPKSSTLKINTDIENEKECEENESQFLNTDSDRISTAEPFPITPQTLENITESNFSNASENRQSINSQQNPNEFPSIETTHENEENPLPLSTTDVHDFPGSKQSFLKIQNSVITPNESVPPAVEGKLPDFIIPEIIEKLKGLDAPPAPEIIITPEIKTTNEQIIKSPPPYIKKEENSSSNANIDPPRLGAELKNDAKRKLSEGDPHNRKKSKKFMSNMTHKLPDKLSKKMKKKAALQNNLSGNTLEAGNNFDETNINDKMQKKALKYLQRLSKSLKGAELFNLIESDKKLSSLLNSSFIATMPLGPDRAKFEKLLKKRMKYKQKILKQSGSDNEKVKKHKEIPVIPKTEPQLEDTPKPVLAVFNSSNEPHLTTNLSENPEKHIENIAESTVYNIQDKNDIPKTLNDAAEQKPIEVKLSSEPDRNKLNIFKKISKQKVAKSLPVPSKKLQTDPILETTKTHPHINLPSGTTITPAPTDGGCDLLLDTNLSATLAGDLKATKSDLSNLNYSNTSEIQSSANFDQQPMGQGYKGKKRGRKPGSKNQPKNLVLDLTAGKAKKQKLSKTATTMPEATAEPLNLSNSPKIRGVPTSLDLSGRNFDSHYAKFETPSLPINLYAAPAPAKDRKERKQTKVKSIPQTYTLTNRELLDDKTANLLPTKEEVNSINKKLLRMDTILKPSSSSMPPSLPLGATIPDKFLRGMIPEMTASAYQMHEAVVPPQKTAPIKQNTTTPKKRQYQNTDVPPGLPHQINELPSSSAGFGNFPTNMMSMFQMYPLRPGLIPSHGLFPTPGIANFPNNPTEKLAANMLIPGFMQFPNMRPTLTPMGNEIDFENNRKTYETFKSADGTQSALDKNYCNVAPLVPESMNLDAAQQSRIDLLSKQMIQGSGSNSTLESGLGAVHNLDSLSNAQFDAQVKKQNENNKAIPSGKRVNKIPTTYEPLNMPLNEPIEVSDDSNESIAKDKLPAASMDNVKSGKNIMSTTKTYDNLVNMSLPTNTNVIPVTETKKQKKVPKLPEVVDLDCIKSETVTALDHISERGVGKLAGGADLIPITGSGTGLAYSSQSIPMTSLTAATASNAYQITPPNLYNNLTIAPTGLTDIAAKSAGNNTFELLKKHNKEHKKLKKFKEGKIKKKKDKKEKHKNKEEIEKHAPLEKHTKNKSSDKDLLKKIKREKKKEKEIGLTSPLVNIPSNKIRISSPAIDEASLMTTTSTLDNTSSKNESTTIVPKLTLKLNANCATPIPFMPPAAAIDKEITKSETGTSIKHDNENRDALPELAKFSPLVTRLPKRTSNTSDLTAVRQTSPTSAHTEPISKTLKDTGNTEKNPFNPPPMKSSEVLQLSAPPNPWISGGTITASSVLLPQQLLQQTTPTETSTNNTSSSSSALAKNANNSSTTTGDPQSTSLLPPEIRPSSYVDGEGNRIWICPACGKVDDGSPMIGCDGCDAWYHWLCVGIFVAPKENEDWFCRVCIMKKKGQHGGGSDKKRKRNKKK